MAMAYIYSYIFVHFSFASMIIQSIHFTFFSDRMELRGLSLALILFVSFDVHRMFGTCDKSQIN